MYDGDCVTMATEKHYYQYDVGAGVRRDLFPVDAQQVKAIVRRVGKVCVRSALV